VLLFVIILSLRSDCDSGEIRGETAENAPFFSSLATWPSALARNLLLVFLEPDKLPA
jgi:hypothetical protein